jgi:hypothetical protein
MHAVTATRKRLTLIEACQRRDTLTDAQAERYLTLMHETSHLLVGQIVGLIPYELRLTSSRSRKPAYVNCYAGHPNSPDIPIWNSKRMSAAKYRKIQEMQIILMLIAGIVYDKHNISDAEFNITQSHPISDWNASRRRLFMLYGKRKKLDLASVYHEFERVVETLMRSATYQSLVDAFAFRLLDTRRRCVHEAEIRFFFHGFRDKVRRLRERHIVPFLNHKINLL